MINDEMQKENAEKFKDILLKTKREGVERVLNELEKIGFFTSPASTKFHGAYPGGLVEHSLNVYRQALCIWKIEQRIRLDFVKVTEENLAIAALLHDVCKADAYRSVEKWQKNPNGVWESYLGYERVFPSEQFGHGEASVIRLLHMGLKMTAEEELAIRWHMGAWDLSNYHDSKTCFDEASKRYPLVPIISCADYLASRISEAT